MLVCSRAVGSRQSSPTDIDTQSSSRLTDNVLLSQQHVVHNAAAAAAGGQFDATGLACSSTSSVVSGLTDSFFTGQYMMDAAAQQQQPDYNQQVNISFLSFCVR